MNKANEDILICPGIRDARHQSCSASTQSSQTRDARPKTQEDGFYGRKADSYSPVSSKPARVRHYHLASDHKWNERSTEYISANQYPHNPSCVHESVVEKNERCYDVCL